MHFSYIRERTYALLTSRACKIGLYLPISALNQPYFSATRILFASSLKTLQALIYKAFQPQYAYYISPSLYCLHTICILFASHDASCLLSKRPSRAYYFIIFQRPRFVAIYSDSNIGEGSDTSPYSP